MIINSIYLLPILKNKFRLVKASKIPMLCFALLMFAYSTLTESGSWFAYIFIGATIAIYNAMVAIFASNSSLMLVREN